MKVIRERIDSTEASILNMRDVKIGDVVLVAIRGKEMPCVVVRCATTPCSSCVINSCRVVPSCRAFRGNTNMAFIPVEEAVE